MGNIEVRNPLFSKKHKRSEARLLIIDDNQIRFNQICDQLKENDFSVVATLLDDVKNFEKQLNFGGVSKSMLVNSVNREIENK